MRCSWVRRQLVRHVEGALSPAEASRVRAHVAECAECSRELRAAESAARILRSTVPAAHEPSADLWRRVAARLPERRAPVRRPVRTWAFAAAALVLLVFVALAAPTLFNRSDRHAVVNGSPTPAGQAPAVNQDTAVPGNEPAPPPQGRSDPFASVAQDEGQGTFPMAPERGGIGPSPSGAGRAPVAVGPQPKITSAASPERKAHAAAGHDGVTIPFATEADRLAYGIKDQPAWAVRDRDPDREARDEASALFSY
jgi:hypothetical protein